MVLITGGGRGLFASARAAFGRPVMTVVNNALASFSFNGDARSGADAISWDEFAAQLEGSVKGALNTTQAALPGLREQDYGRIVNIATNRPRWSAVSLKRSV